MTDDPNEYTTFSALFRIVDGYTPASEYSEALVFEAGELAEPLKLTPTELATAIRSWAFEHGDRERTVELRRAETDIGAAGVDLALVVTFFAGVAAEVALEELYQFVRSRLFRMTPSARRWTISARWRTTTSSTSCVRALHGRLIAVVPTCVSCRCIATQAR